MQVFNYGGMAADAINQFGDSLSNAMAMRENRNAMQQQKDVMTGLADLYANGATTQELYEYGLQNPAAFERVGQAIGFKNDQTKQIMRDTLIDSLQNPEQRDQIITRGAEAIRAAGGDPRYLSQSVGDTTEDFERGAIPFLASLGDQGAGFAKSYMGMKPQQASKEFQYKDGIVFDPSTGEVKKTEFYNQGNSGQGGEQSTSNMKDFQFYQELKKSNPEMAEEFAVKAGIKKVAPKKGMSVTTERILNDAQNAAYDAFSSSDSITSLADSYAQNKGDLGGGLFGSAQEAFKEFAGGEDEISSLKKQYARIKNSLVIKSLPQGPATDRDIAIFSKGFPGENADPEYIESFLRGMAKSQYITGRFNEFKAQHISDKGNTSGLMRAWKEESKKLDSELKEKFPEQSMPNVSSLSDEDLLNG